jgi:hypothetical protein
VKLNVPATVGVPEINPLEAVKLKPPGSAPALRLQLYGAVPPLAVKVALYTVPCVPPVNEPVVILTGGIDALIVRLNALVAACAVGAVESVTFTVKLKVPEAVGVPEMTPLDAVKVNPEGSEPELILHVYGIVPPLAAIVAL